MLQRRLLALPGRARKSPRLPRYVLLTVVVALLACKTFKKVEQCNSLIDKINAAQQAAQQLDSDDASTEELKKLGKEVTIESA